LTLSAFRVERNRFRDSPFSGTGARLFGGRWNSPGTPLVYLSEHLSLALLEILVHADTPDALRDRFYLVVEFEDQLVRELAGEDLPGDWRGSPETEATARIGDAWARSRSSLLLRVPSAILPREHNYLLNPLHPDMERLRITEGPEQLVIDSRLMS
jgi:RES domain-containing protein